MCGLVGYSYKSIFDNQINHKLVNSLYHRGPDDQGSIHFEDYGIFFGHARTSIIDIKNGKQPLSTPDGNYSIIFNGGIYNFESLKEILISKGYNFYTTSDTEVLLYSYIEWGEKVSEKLDGDFVFAIFDKKKEIIFFSRDHLGTKPLFFYKYQDFFMFASELKTFKFLPSNLKPKVDKQILTNKIFKDSENDQDTFLSNVFNSDNGTNYIYSLKNKKLLKSRYFFLQENKLKIQKYEESIEHLNFLLTNSCKLRAKIDVNLTSSLSGGIDSSIITAISSRELDIKKKYNTVFSIHYKDDLNPEFSNAKVLANRNHLNHEVLYLDPKKTDFDLVDKISFHNEMITEPALGPWLLFEFMKKKGFKVSLDGHGADELFAGYKSHPEKIMKSDLSLIFSDYWKDLDITRYEIMDENEKLKYRPSSKIKFIIKYFLARNNKMEESVMSQFLAYKPQQNRQREKSKYISRYKFNNHLYDQMFNGSFQTLNKKFDRLSMAHGFEIRPPFFDKELIRFALSLPPEFKIKDGFSKKILRDTFKENLPLDTIARKNKQGFSPQKNWYVNSLTDYVIFKLSEPSFLNSSLFDGKSIRNHYHNFSKNRSYKMTKQIFSLIQANTMNNNFS